MNDADLSLLIKNMGLIHKITFVPRFIRQALYIPFNKLMFISAGANVGKNFRIRNRFYLKLYPKASLTIGHDFTVHSGEAINPITRNVRGCFFVNGGGNLTIGNNVGMSSPTIWCDEKIVIGNDVRIGALVTILDTDCHSLNYVDRMMGDKNTKTMPVVIEDGVLIGAQSIVLKGSHIGARTVIGAGSVVCGNIPSDCIAAGNPCKFIRKNAKV